MISCGPIRPNSADIGPICLACIISALRGNHLTINADLTTPGTVRGGEFYFNFVPLPIREINSEGLQTVSFNRCRFKPVTYRKSATADGYGRSRKCTSLFDLCDQIMSWYGSGLGPAEPKTLVYMVVMFGDGLSKFDPLTTTLLISLCTKITCGNPHG